MVAAGDDRAACANVSGAIEKPRAANSKIELKNKLVDFVFIPFPPFCQKLLRKSV